VGDIWAKTCLRGGDGEGARRLSWGRALQVGGPAGAPRRQLYGEPDPAGPGRPWKDFGFHSH
jgi:hypothetical protein